MNIGLNALAKVLDDYRNKLAEFPTYDELAAILAMQPRVSTNPAENEQLARDAQAIVDADVAALAASFQARVQPWMMACFGAEISADGAERNHRFLEESLELVQACGCTASEAHQLVDYVYGRPVGERAQEVGGVMVTLAALCLAQGLDMHAAGETELSRIWTKVEAIRAKQAAKPKHSPLPIAAVPQVVALGQASRAKKIGGSYQADGTIVSTFATLAGETRHVFEFDQPAGMLHIFGPGQVEIAASVAAPLVVADERAAFEAWVRKTSAMPQKFADQLKVAESSTAWMAWQARAALQAAPVQPVAVPDGLRKAFVTLESFNGRYSVVMKFNQKTDAFAVHDFLLGVGGKDYNSAAPAAQGDAKDTERMNFLVMKIVDVRQELRYGSRLEFTSQAQYDDDEFTGTTLRAQIDAAIAAKAAS